ncbi:hypothetical protein [Nonomuraea sp. NPDC050786]|uniref:hypothetical protein n=1 Tax=Nonomuraea sp. NPDC050786 TaxID=3154840 RepID=UPI0033C41183
MPDWRVVERAVLAKAAGHGEDRLVVLEDGSGVHCAAVIDGVTDKSGRDFGGASGGAVAADCVARTLAALPGDVTVGEAVAFITAELAELRRTWAVADDDPLAPAAVAAVVWPRRRLMWRVGDVHLAVGHLAVDPVSADPLSVDHLSADPLSVDHLSADPLSVDHLSADCLSVDCHSVGRRSRGRLRWERHVGGKLIDTVLAGARAAYLHCLLLEGQHPETLAATDPGRALIRPVLERQATLANRDDAGPFGYGVLDGRPVPERFIETFLLPEEAWEVVLTSDGYLGPAPNLVTAEAELRASLQADRLRIMDHAATKGMAPDARSFDDRAYLRLSRDGYTGPADTHVPDA